MCVFWISHRRSFLSDEVFSPSLFHQLPPQREVRTGSTGDHTAIRLATLGIGALPNFQLRRTQAGTGNGELLCAGNCRQPSRIAICKTRVLPEITRKTQN